MVTNRVSYALAEAGWYVMTLCACVKGVAMTSPLLAAAGGSCRARDLPPSVQRVVAPVSTSTGRSLFVSLWKER